VEEVSWVPTACPASVLDRDLFSMDLMPVQLLSPKPTNQTWFSPLERVRDLLGTSYKPSDSFQWLKEVEQCGKGERFVRGF
jgi:hypothetical protein